MQKNMQKSNKETSNKLGTAGAEGVDYQLNLILHVLLQVKKLDLGSFELYSELITAGKFDDLVLIYEDNKNAIKRSCLLQAKHVIDETKTVLFSDLVNGDKFNLTKYFDSFKQIIKEDQFKDNLEHLILFTNLNISQSLLPYVEVVQPQLTIWNCPPVEGNKKQPQLYKLNPQFIEEYQYFQLRVLANVILDFCIKNLEMKHMNNNFIDYQVLLSKEVFNVDEKCFRKEFIEGDHLGPGTQIFRDIFEEEIQNRRKKEGSAINVDTPKWLRDQTLKFSKDFGKPSARSKVLSFQPSLKHDEKELFNKFSSYLILALNQPNDGELEECLTNECLQYFSQSIANMAKGELKFKIRQWFKDSTSSPLTIQFLKEEMELIKDNEQEANVLKESNKEIAEILNLKIEYETLSLMSDIEMFMEAGEQILFQISTKNSDLSSMKIINCLDKLNHKYMVTSKSEVKELREVFLKSKCFSLLVWQQFVHSAKDRKLLLDHLNALVVDIKDKGKKVIVIINESQNVSAAQFGAAEDWIQRNLDVTKYEHLTENTRSKLLRRNVSFQGYDMKMNNILEHGIQLDQLAQDSWGELSSNGDIRIGQNVNLSKEYNTDYYIQRTIVLKNTDRNSEMETSFSESEFIQHALLEDQCQAFEGATRKINPKIFIFSGAAGMGKTTVSSSLADEIKRSHPHFWVTRLVAMDCASDLNHFDEDTTSDVTFYDFLISKLLKLSSPLERYVFGTYLMNENSVNKIVILFDGYDEINEKNQRVIMNLFQYLGRKPNIGFIVITTRPQCHIDSTDKQSILKPFNEENKIQFLCRYWTSRGLKENPNRLAEYVEQLIQCISCSITKNDSQLTGIPLQMKMFSEIYEKEASDYVQNKSIDFEFSTMSFGLFDLYEKFTNIKAEIFLNDKSKDVGLGFIDSMINSIQRHQSKFARKIILGPSALHEVDVIDLELSTQLGIIQKNPEGDFYFIHRTFAEFLTAKYLLEECIEKPSIRVVDKLRKGLLVEKMKDSDFHVVRRFINCRLNSAKLAEECMSSKDQREMKKLLFDRFKRIIITSAEQELYEFLKLTIEVIFWLRPDQIFNELKSCLVSAAYISSKCLTGILDCMLDVWLPSKNVILMKTLEYLIHEILLEYKTLVSMGPRLIISTINFQDKLERAGMITEEELGNILSNATDYVLQDRGWFWRWQSFEYYEYLYSTHRKLFYDFFNGNRRLLHSILSYHNNKFLLLIQSDKEIDAEWVFFNFIEDKMVEFVNWDYEHFKFYLNILQFSVAQLDLEKKEKFQHYLEEIVEYLLDQHDDLSWMEIYSEFLMSYETIISLDKIVSKFAKTEITEVEEYWALWGPAKKQKEILTAGGKYDAAVERFQLGGETDDPAATKCRILNSIRERQGEEEFLQWIGQRNWQKNTILQHALLREDNINIELISTWITTVEIFAKIMSIDDDKYYNESEIAIILKYVNNKFPQHRMSFLEINKNKIITDKLGREEIFRIIENEENMSQLEFEQILKLEMDRDFSKGDNILFYIILYHDVAFFKKCLNLIKKFSLDTETVTQLFSNKMNHRKVSLIDCIIGRPDHMNVCIDFLDELNLLEQNDETEALLHILRKEL